MCYIYLHQTFIFPQKPARNIKNTHKIVTDIWELSQIHDMLHLALVDRGN